MVLRSPINASGYVRVSGCFRLHNRKAHDFTMDTEMDPELLALMLAHEEGTATAEETLDLFSNLIQTGQAWTLQGSYGRAAEALITAGFLDDEGTILRGIDE